MSIIPREAAVAETSYAASAESRAAELMKRRSRIRFYEIIIWAAAIAAYFVLPSKMLILTEIAILALFAVSLDLVLGFAGIVSLGHAAFFGLGAYVAGLVALHYIAEPVAGLLLAGLVSGLFGFLVSFLILRGSDLTRLMTTLGIGLMMAEVANQMAWLTGGADGLSGFALDPIFGLFEFDLFGKTGYVYCLVVLFVSISIGMFACFGGAAVTLSGFSLANAAAVSRALRNFSIVSGFCLTNDADPTSEVPGTPGATSGNSRSASTRSGKPTRSPRRRAGRWSAIRPSPPRAGRRSLAAGRAGAASDRHPPG